VSGTGGVCERGFVARKSRRKYQRKKTSLVAPATVHRSINFSKSASSVTSPSTDALTLRSVSDACVNVEVKLEDNIC